MPTSLRVRPESRRCVAERVSRLDTRQLRRDILLESGVSRGFEILPVPLPAHDDTHFKVVHNGKQVLIAVALYDSLSFLSRRDDDPDAFPDDVGLIFDLRRDGLGFFQVHFAPPRQAGPDNAGAHRDREYDADYTVYEHQPYAEAYRSTARELNPQRHRWQLESFSPCTITQMRVRWLFVWFQYDDLFVHGETIGFNVVRNRPYADEFSGWNYCSGNGALDATGLGRLSVATAAGRPTTVVRAVRAKDNLVVSGAGRPAALELIDPLGATHDVAIIRGADDEWEFSYPLGRRHGGRWRLVAPDADASWSIDLPPARHRARQFALSVLYDSPMSVIAQPYTPERLATQLAVWRELGVDRVHLQNYSDWPSFWEQPIHHWHESYGETVKACGNYFGAAAAAARDAGLELVGDHKVFDLGFNCFFVDADGKSTVVDIENRDVCVIPEIAAHQEWTMQTNSAWHPAPAAMIGRVRLYSDRPLPDIRGRDVKVFQSAGNQSYRRCRGITVRLGRTRRPHAEWTPAGPRPLPGSESAWYLEIDGLRLRSPYLAIDCGSDDVFIENRAWRVVDAFTPDGAPAPVTIATNGDRDGGFFFWKGWQGWNNFTEPLLCRRRFDGRRIGIAFCEQPNTPTMLEPAYAGARGIWLNRLGHSLDCGADAVAIRTYCHHNGLRQTLAYAYAPPVVAAFTEQHGRPPTTTAADYHEIRRIRGDAFTAFMRDAAALVHGRKRKLIAILESGIEVPDTHDVRMQLPLYWRQWIEEGVIDEIRLKYFTAENPWIHRELLPLARRHDVPVHLTSRCLHTGVGCRPRELATETVATAVAAGFAGFCLYEQHNLMDQNPLGRSVLKGPVREWFAAANAARGR
jgi:hypothetical protein